MKRQETYRPCRILSVTFPARGGGVGVPCPGCGWEAGMGQGVPYPGPGSWWGRARHWGTLSWSWPGGWGRVGDTFGGVGQEVTCPGARRQGQCGGRVGISWGCCGVGWEQGGGVPCLGPSGRNSSGGYPVLVGEVPLPPTLGKDLGPVSRVPPHLPILCTDEQTENITSRRTSYSGGNQMT